MTGGAPTPPDHTVYNRFSAAHWRARPALPDDNAALVTLAAACPMEGDIGLCVDRSPDFFALNRLEGEAWRVDVVDAADGTLAGCIAIARRRVYMLGVEREVMYFSDLKVHPDHRGSGAAEALIRHAWQACREMGGDEVPTLVTVLAGNAAIERRARGPRGSPPWTNFARLVAHSVSLVWKRRVPAVAGMRVERACAADLAEMAELWQKLAPARNFAPAFAPGGFEAWIEQAPGLEPESYWLLRGDDGRIAAFLGLWDQETFKHTRVVRYSRPLAAFRLSYNLLAPLIGAARLPGRGSAMRFLTAVHVCVPPDRPAMLRALVLSAYDALRGRGYAFFSVGLDAKDPLSAAFDGLLGQTTQIDAYVACPAGRYDGAPLDGAPLHFEIALV